MNTSSPRPVGPRKASEKSARARAREFAVQALYQVLVGQDSLDGIKAYTRELSGFNKADAAHFETLLMGCATQRQALDELLGAHLDRALGAVSPIERVILWIGAYELKHCPDVPLRVVLNECIELAKSFGGTDGHKFVNAVLHPLAPRLRPFDAT